MIQKEKRLTTEEVKGLFSIKKTLHSNYFTLIYNQDMSGPKFAVIVSKKVSPKAVYRNKVRRYIYAEIAKIIAKKPLKTGHFAINVKTNTRGVDTVLIKEDLALLLSKVVNK